MNTGIIDKPTIYEIMQPPSLQIDAGIMNRNLLGSGAEDELQSLALEEKMEEGRYCGGASDAGENSGPRSFTHSICDNRSNGA